MEDATKTPPGAHSHEITSTPAEAERARRGVTIKMLLTSTGASQQHNVDVVNKKNKWRITHCDDYDKGKHQCRGGHGMWLTEVSNV